MELANFEKIENFSGITAEEQAAIITGAQQIKTKPATGKKDMPKFDVVPIEKKDIAKEVAKEEAPKKEFLGMSYPVLALVGVAILVGGYFGYKYFFAKKTA